jgi:3-hydroxyisobutyrate dehydrogenase
VALVGCPVSGGVARAESGELAMMVGGDAETVRRVMPVLRAMGSSIHHCGATGAGHAMKALNNLVSAGGFLVGIEALLVGQRFGLEPARMVEVLNASTGMNNSTQKKFGQFVLSRAFDSGFSLWADAAIALGPRCDHTEMARFCERTAGLELT